MPRNAIVTIPIRTWTELTANDVTAVGFSIQSIYPVLLTATTGPAPAGPPDDTICTHEFRPGMIVPMTVWLSDLWGGVAGAKRLWAWSEGSGARVAVSHV